MRERKKLKLREGKSTTREPSKQELAQAAKEAKQVKEKSNG